MGIISTKPTVKAATEACLEHYRFEGIDGCVFELHGRLLSQKVKFPLLEYCAKLLYQALPETDQIQLCDGVDKQANEGGNVILGMMLQLRLPQYFEASFQKAAEYIRPSDQWYVCDIIGERVFGHGLLTFPERALPLLREMLASESSRVVRAIGAGFHYAIKKGLNAAHAKEVFELLLTKAQTKDSEAKQGVGWAAKTMAKFHPEIITAYQSSIDDPQEVAPWFRTKVAIGIQRHLHAKGN